MLALLNAAPNTGNQGVSALCLSAVDGLTARGHSEIAIADHGRGLRRAEWQLGARRQDVHLFGLSHTRRLWREDCLRRVYVETRIGAASAPGASMLRASEAVLDVSGGDSFTDLYGQKRFDAMVLTKRLALAAGRPLILLPQTLGPFHSDENRATARDILAAATAIWVRDAKSLDTLRDMLGARFDPARHRLGVDMALRLPETMPQTLPPRLFGWLTGARSFPVVGLNVSGLLCSDAEAARGQFCLAAPHTLQIDAAARALLAADPALKLILVSHVLRPEGDPESDHDAARALKAGLGPDFADRILVVPQDYTATELKWIIARLDWFAGARMQATIAGLSSGVPTLGLGYSDKSAGVFAACGFRDHVADLRGHSACRLGAAVAASFAKRAETRALLAKRLPDLMARADRQMDEIAALCGSVSNAAAAA